MTNRRKGAQPGNINALRHGFYSNIFRGQELTDLDQVPTDDMDGEIKLLRVLVRRTAEIFDGVGDIRDTIGLLNAIAGSASQLSSVIYKKYLMSGNADGKLSDNLNGAIERLRQEGFYSGKPRPNK